MDNELDEDLEELPPSKSSRKREAHALQKLGERLVKMRPEDLATLPMPESLVDAIAEARRLSSRSALGRQYQYIGKLMRDVDVEALEAALDDLTVTRNTRARLRTNPQK
jgi:ribosome-associated protein